MQINSVDDLLKAIEEKRTELKMSERQLSGKIGRSPSIYWWWKRNTGTTSFTTVLEYCKALGLTLFIK